MTLNELKIGECGSIKEVNGTGNTRLHLLEMGLIPQANIKVIKYAPMGDPIEILIHGYNLTLRLNDAKNIIVDPIDQNIHCFTNCGDCSNCKNCDKFTNINQKIKKDISLKKESLHPGLGETGKFHDKKTEPAIKNTETLNFALLGNQNTGKTTLFNALTGSNQHVGNFPGVTVEKKSGKIIGIDNSNLVDLPGIYSLFPYSNEEKISRDYIINEKPHCIINIIDANTIERNLYLTLQALELNIPMVLAVNMIDEFYKNGGSIDINEMEKRLGIPVVPVSAANGYGLDELIRHAYHIAKFQEKPNAENLKINTPASFIEDKDLYIISNRYRLINEICEAVVKKPAINFGREASNKVDKILTGKYTGIPIFIIIMGIIFYITFSLLGPILQNALSNLINTIATNVDNYLNLANVNIVIRLLIKDGVFNGVGTVLSFIPIILLLFFFLSLLEDSGYMARVAFVMDNLLRKIGVSGRSIVPMIIGFGCTVPAVISTRTIPSDRDRKLTIFILPFITCSAKLPIYGFFASIFFKENAGLIMITLYVFSLILGIIFSIILKTLRFKGEPVPFIMELPTYRFPSPINVLKLLWEKTKDFLQKAFTIIFIATIIIWFLQNFDIRFNLVTDTSTSLLANISGFIAPLFKPLELNDYRIITSLITGFLAKESVISTASILFGGIDAIKNVLSIKAVVSILVFSSLYTPCIAAITAIKKELGLQTALLIIIFQCVLAYVMAYLISLPF